MSLSRRFWKRCRPLRTKQRARVPSHFTSKMWSGESKGSLESSASIGLSARRYGSATTMRSACLRGGEAGLEGCHEVLCRLRGRSRHDRDFLPLDLRRDQLNERLPVAVLEPGQVELRREGGDQLKGQVQFLAGDDDGHGRGDLRGAPQLVLV